MIRSFFSVALIGVAGLALAPAFLQGCAQTGVGAPCTPEQEYDPTFLGFAVGEVNVESKSFDCQTRLCLANHFQGRVTCPYGQTKAGAAPATTSSNGYYNDTAGNPIGPCELPGSGPILADGGLPPGPGGSSVAITGTPGDTTDGALVAPQCTDRTGGGNSPSAVYCSCRCANINGQTNDGAAYCSCPSGFTCQQLVTPIGANDTGLTGAYCIINNTQYNSLNTCETCDATKANCGTFHGL
jgi:hypothetical protein